MYKYVNLILSITIHLSEKKRGWILMAIKDTSWIIDNYAYLDDLILLL